jgi:hypothetical protein
LLVSGGFEKSREITRSLITFGSLLLLLLKLLMKRWHLSRRCFLLVQLLSMLLLPVLGSNHNGSLHNNRRISHKRLCNQSSCRSGRRRRSCCRIQARRNASHHPPLLPLLPLHCAAAHNHRGYISRRKRGSRRASRFWLARTGTNCGLRKFVSFGCIGSGNCKNPGHTLRRGR